MIIFKLILILAKEVTKKKRQIFFFILNGILNLITTFALSITMYLLMANLSLLIQKLQNNLTSLSESTCVYDLKNYANSEIDYKISFMKHFYTNEPRKTETPLFVY